MQTRLWLAGAAATAVLATGAFIASPVVHGQDEKPAPSRNEDAAPDPERLGRDIEEAVQEALERAGVSNGRLSADMRRAVDEATRAAEQVVRDIDVDVLVDDAMQGVQMPGERPRIGVSTRDLTAEEAKGAGLAGITGAYVTDVPAESAAGKAGLQAGDIIVSVDGETIRSARHLARVIVETPEGRALQVAYVRGGAKHTATVTPEARGMSFRRMPGPGLRNGDGPMVWRPEGAREFFFRRGPEDGARIRAGSRARLGVMAQPLTEQLATYFGVKDGVLVTQVTANSAAATAGIRAGDVITAVNGKPVKDTGDILESLEGVEAGKSVPVEITRDKKAQTVTVTLAKPSNTSGDRPAPRRPRFTA